MNSKTLTFMHYSSVLNGEIVAIGALAVVIVGMFLYREERKSSRWLLVSVLLEILHLIGDAGTFEYSLYLNLPLPLAAVFYFMAYSFGPLTTIAFVMYVKSYIEERAGINKWIFRVPVILEVFTFCVTAAAIASGNVYGIADGRVTAVGSIPFIATLIPMLVIIYIPIAAMTKVKTIGWKAVFLLGLFGIVPGVTMFISYDYSVITAAFALLIVYILLQCDTSAEKEKQRSDLAELNAQLEENQAQLEETASEQEAQIEEIQKLNYMLAEYNKALANAGTGMWRIILKEGASPRMQGNEKMKELLGIAGQELSEEEIYSAWYGRIVPEAIPSVQASVGEMMAGKFSENTYQWNHPKKGVIYVRCGGTADKLKDGSHVLSGYHAEVTDIVLDEQKHNAQLERAKKDAEAASAAKTSFLFNMSHDIRTPMNAIMGFTDLIEKHYGDREKCMDYIHKTQEANKLLLSLINNVLEMARIESGKEQLDETICQTGVVTHEMISIFEDKMSQKHISFTSKIAIQTPYMLCDQPKLREICLNILSNAVKYTPEGGSIHVEMLELPCEKPGYARIRGICADTGIGMSKEFLPHLFEEFTREQTTTESRQQGTGLGMPIVKKLIDLMGGSIEVESEPGKGTTFTVTIDLKIENITPEAKTENEAGASQVDFAGKRILLAEDNALNAEIAIEILSEAGFEVEHAVDGIICVEMLQKAEIGYYDLIFMDIQMPNMDGYKATKLIRSMNDPYRNQIPIIAMTANAFDEDKRNALAAGMNGHLAKPIEIPRLMETLALVLK